MSEQAIRSRRVESKARQPLKGIQIEPRILPSKSTNVPINTKKERIVQAVEDVKKARSLHVQATQLNYLLHQSSNALNARKISTESFQNKLLQLVSKERSELVDEIESFESEKNNAIELKESYEKLRVYKSALVGVDELRNKYKDLCESAERGALVLRVDDGLLIPDKVQLVKSLIECAELRCDELIDAAIKDMDQLALLKINDQEERKLMIECDELLYELDALDSQEKSIICQIIQMAGS